ncbi:hypothetical protein EVAR_52090_1 [Eumeta japonica]|uniref:Uncharacterized protein n=1 Tax=Eumeta variegata TaxID=151549 RepID=A0A4C1Y433_EUMVA|nr:hypothetical protein EVAR_52090_1 [Eumeta japonica]
MDTKIRLYTKPRPSRNGWRPPRGRRMRRVSPDRAIPADHTAVGRARLSSRRSRRRSNEAKIDDVRPVLDVNSSSTVEYGPGLVFITDACPP